MSGGAVYKSRASTLTDVASYSAKASVQMPTLPLLTARPPAADPSKPTVVGPTEDLEDPREWLEEVLADDALSWVKSRNAAALSVLGDPKSQPDYSRILSILDSKEKIPYIGRVLNGTANSLPSAPHLACSAQPPWLRCGGGARARRPLLQLLAG